ncbi:Glycine-rich RNA-binding protein 2, mitochondrial [Savitreella phatthalungensis]
MAGETITSGSLIFVTGATGFIASHAVDQLLKKGYRVRGTVRDTGSDKAEHLRTIFKEYGDKFELVQAEDLVQPGVFDGKVDGAAGILHIASPFHNKEEDPYRDLIDPATKGTENLLNAAFKASSVRHVVITSSVAAVFGPPKNGEPAEKHTYTEEDWNDAAEETVRKDPKNYPPGTAYRASKNAAERLAWKFVDDKKPNFTLSVINPPLVFGPAIHKISSVDSINTSVALLFKYFKDPNADIPPPMTAQAYVDVRDVAKAHILALEKPEAAGKRFITSSGQASWAGVVRALGEVFPDHKVSDKGPGATQFDVAGGLSNERSRQVLGLDYIDLHTAVKDTINALKQFW